MVTSEADVATAVSAAPIPILREDVQRLVAAGAQLVETLPARLYEREHLPGALSIPLAEMTRETTARLQRGQPVIVYCASATCDLSARAAWKLKSLGFTFVYDYVAGKDDWFAAGLPREGQEATLVRAGDRAQRGAPTCSLTDRIGSVKERTRAAGWDACVVMNDERIVLGVLEGEALDAEPQAPAEQEMDPAPVTYRADATLDAINEELEKHDLDRVWITTSNGELVGLLRREDAQP